MIKHDLAGLAFNLFLEQKNLIGTLQYVHEYQIPHENISEKILFCVMTPNYLDKTKIKSYRFDIRLELMKNLSHDVKHDILGPTKCNTRSMYLKYYDPYYHQFNNVPGLAINLDFEDDKRDPVCLGETKKLPIPSHFNIGLDGQIIT
jgi:hypothetical protein